MAEFWEFLKQPVAGIPIAKLAAVLLLIIAALLFRKLFSGIITKRILKLTQKTKTKLDDALVGLLAPPLNSVLLVFSLALVRLILVPYLNPKVDEFLTGGLQLSIVIIGCWLLYRSADFVTIFLQRAADKTPTELDDLLVPYLRKIIKVAAVIIVILKAAEVFLGMSATALFGFLGGMGLTLGLVFKDIIANWFGCGIIYMDNLFREGDWVQLDDGKVIDADVEEIGIRSTKFRNFDKTVSVVPNAVIMNAVVKNWSRMYKRRVMYYFTIDGISSFKLERILDGIRNILGQDDQVHQEFHMVNFRELSGNARVIRLYYFTKTTVWAEHESVREKINLKILQLLQKENVDQMAYTIVDLSDDKPERKESRARPAVRADGGP